MCWVALDRLLKLHESGLVRAPVRQFAGEQAAIRREVEARGYSERLRSYVTVFDGEALDASLLLFAFYGYADPQSARMHQTCDRVHEHLERNGWLYRYLKAPDGLPPGEGAFGICSFWAVECQALQGDLDGAAAAFEKVCSYANDLRLFAEEVDPDSRAALGNFPRAFTHVGLISAALTLAEPARRQSTGDK